MRLIKEQTHIDFMHKRWVALAISLAVILLVVGSLMVQVVPSAPVAFLTRSEIGSLR